MHGRDCWSVQSFGSGRKRGKRRQSFVAVMKRGQSHLANVAIFAERRFVSICESISLAKRENRLKVMA